jgi:hypothetical protein
MIHEVLPPLTERIPRVIWGKKVHMNMGPILNI